MKLAVWKWGGFGFGLWRSVWPQGAIWSIALGPVTLLIQRAGRNKEEQHG